MKQIALSMKSLSRQFVISTGLLIVLLIPFNLLAQTDSTKTSEEESTALSPTLEFSSVQKGDNTIDLKAFMQVKYKGSFVKLPLLKVTFLQVTDTAEKDLGFVITDRVGKAVINVNAAQLAPDKEGKLHFKAVYAGNKTLEAAEGEVTISRAHIEITPVKEDSLLKVNVKLLGLGNGVDTPVKEAVIGIYVKRMFFPMKIGEGTTDENGEATIEVPQNLPGDPKGNITLIAKLDESEQFGNLETSVAQPWGTPVSNQFRELPRALWSAHPPLWMMITFIILVGTVWGHYLVIIFQLFRLRKEEPEPDSPTVEHII